MIELQLLGPTSLTSPGEDPAGLLGRRKHLALLAYLAVEPGSHHRRSVLCGLLWPETDGKRARRSLRVALHDIRRELGEDVVVSRSDGALAVDPDRVVCDVPRLVEAVKDTRGPEIARLYRGPFLHGFYTGSAPFDRWIEEERAALERVAVEGLRRAARTALDRKEWGKAVELAGAALEIRRLDVAAIELQVEGLTGLGRGGRALAELEAFRAEFVEELELPPPAALDALEERVHEGAVGSPEDGAQEEEDGEVAGDVPGSAAEAPAPVPPGGELREERRDRLFSGPWGRAALGLGGLAFVVLVVAIASTAGVWSPELPVHVPAPEARQWMEEGRRLGSLGRYGEAVAAFRAAVSADPEWGEAYYELALAARWGDWGEVSSAALDDALARVDAMGPVTRELTRALELSTDGEVLAARELYLGILADAPDDPRALRELGELEFHWGPTLGIPARSARPRFSGVLEQEPGNPEALLHLIRLDAMAGDSASVTRLAGRFRGASSETSEGAREEVQALAAVVRGVHGAATADALTPGSMVGVMRSVAASRAPPGVREAFFGRLAEIAPGERERVLAHLFRAQVALEGGRVGEAREWLDRLGPSHAARRDEFGAAALTLPFLLPSSEPMAELDRRLAGYSSGLLITPTDADLLAPAIYAPRRVFLRALLRGPGRVGGGADAFQALTQRTWMDTASIGLMKRVVEVRHGLDTGVDSQSLWEALGPPTLRPDRQYPTVLSYPTAHLRYWRARLLRQMGRDEEALEWYRTFPDPRGYDIAFLPGVLVERGRVERRLGMAEAARGSFERALDLLRDADPPYRSLMAAASRGLAGL